MLRLLRIRNFAIIDELELEFDGGLSVITGETGAGKSIILDAIGLILGNRANTEIIRSGAEEATVEALFETGKNDALEKKLTAYGIDLKRMDHELLVKRTVHKNGKNRIFLNGELITLTQLAHICEDLVDLCSQHEHQSLSKASYQLDLLDRYGGLIDVKRTVREVYSALRSKEAELQSLLGHGSDTPRTEDFLKFQINEIEEFAPQEGEEEALNQERKRLIHASSLQESVGYILSLMDSSASEGFDVLTLVGKAQQRLSKAQEQDPSLDSFSQALERAKVELQEASFGLNQYADSLEIDPDRLDTVEKRLNEWSRIKKKYGSTLNEILTTRDKLQSELYEFSHKQERIAKIESQLSHLKEEYLVCAQDLSARRKAIARTLEETVQQELSELMMPQTRFEVSFEEHEWSSEGLDKAQFLFSPNPGETPKPIGRIASGGELSRVMLSIRRTISDRGGIGVYLFDEIDAGIGGQTASIVGRKLRSVAKYNQVICITHLPQVAAYATKHYSVEKRVVSGRTISEIHALTNTARVGELARMLGGLNVTDKSKAHAKELLKQAEGV